MNQKSYNVWTPIKSKLHNDNNIRPGFHEREVWYCHLGENIGFEQDGKEGTFLRPVVIVKKFNNEIFWAIPLTSAIKKGKYYFIVSLNGIKRSSAILSQIRLIDAKRLSHKIGNVPNGEFITLKKTFKDIMS